MRNMSAISFFWMLLFLPSTLFSQVVINEFLAANIASYYNRDFYVFSDWLELKNSDPDTINLGGYFLSDDTDDLFKWQIPENTLIGPGKVKVFFADEIDLRKGETYYYVGYSGGYFDSITVQYDHLNFKLSSEEGWISLVNPAGIIIDSIYYEQQLPDVSQGRDPNNPDQWVFFAEPTAGLLNTTQLFQEPVTAEEPVFSIKGGIFPDIQNITLSADSSTSQIYYTTDGSIPDTNSVKYLFPVEITSTTVIRARVFDSIHLPGPIITHTYIIDENSDLNIISIAMNPEFLWDDSIGIYIPGVNGVKGKGSAEPKNWNQDWERPINIEFFSTEDNLEFNLQAGTKIYGYASRKGDQKSFSFYMKKKYGTEYLNYQLFKDKPCSQYKRFILRNRGQRSSAHLKLNDVMMQSVIADINVDDQAYEPAVLFINGEYWGIYSIREKLDNFYTESNFGQNPDNVDFIEHGLKSVMTGDVNHYNKMLDFLEQNDMSLDKNYDYIKTQMQIDEYINYQITEIYSSNYDWPANNIKYWRPKTINGQWRWVLYDVDNAFEFANRNSLAYAMAPNGPSWPNPPYSTYLFRKLLENDHFKYQFIQQFASHLNITFDPARVTEIANSINQEVESEIAKHMLRWGSSLIMYVNGFVSTRNHYLREYILAEFDLDSYSQLSLNFNKVEGLIFINNVQLTDENFTGLYFEEVPIQIKAIAKPGYKFVEWTGISTDYSTSIVIYGDSVIYPVFEESTEIGDVFINEVMADNEEIISDPQGDFDDWIEIYNGGDGIVDIGGLFITDDLSEPNKYLIPDTQPDSTQIFPGDFLILWADKDISDGVLHVNIKLSKDGEQIGLFNPEGLTVMDTMSFPEQITDISYGRYYDGEQQWVTMHNPTPQTSNIYYLNLEAKIFLEGPFLDSEMSVALNESGVIPTVQPFNDEPWNYAGNEQITTLYPEAIDWVLIELRDTTEAAIATPEAIITTQAAILLKDGSIVDTDGNSLLKFFHAVRNGLFMVIYHRNHLAVMSSQALIETEGVYSYNFTLGETMVLGGIDGHKEISEGIWGMMAGDCNGDGVINSVDLLLWKTEAATKGYKGSDMNLNHELNNEDKNKMWFNNQGKESHVPQ